jgi:hypothetical protein
VGLDYRRNLLTLVNGLNNDSLPEAKMAYEDAIIVNVGLSLGTFNPNTTSFVERLRVAAGSYDWTWLFGPHTPQVPGSFVRNEQLGAGNWTAVSGRGDGQQIVTVNQYGYLYMSYDFGVTWAARTAIGTQPWAGGEQTRVVCMTDVAFWLGEGLRFVG